VVHGNGAKPSRGDILNYNDFLTDTIMSIDPATFEMLKKSLVGEYLSFSIIHERDVSQAVLAEKICDYFEKLELKTGKDFAKQIEAYIKDIDSIVSRRIAHTPQAKKKDSAPVDKPRSRKYYEKAIATKNSRNLSVQELVDYSRIMFCLYAAIIKDKYKEINDFDYSVSSLKPDAIIESMKTEPNTNVMVKKNRFDIKNLYCSDRCTFIISIIMLYKIINDRVQGEYYHE